jgi:hypothetical protein
MERMESDQQDKNFLLLDHKRNNTIIVSFKSESAPTKTITKLAPQGAMLLTS